MAAVAMQRDMFMPRAPRGMGRGLMLAIAAHVLLVIALSFSVSWHSQTPEGVEAELWAAVPQIAAPRAVDAPPPPAPTPAPTPKPVPRVQAPDPVVTPPAPPAPPAPRPDAQIATERAEKKETKRVAAEQAAEVAKAAEKAAAKDAEKQKALKAKQVKAAQDQAQQKKDDAAASAQLAAQLATQREANLKRIVGQAGATGGATATGNAAQQAGPSADYLGRIKARIKPNVSFPDTVAGNPAVEIEVRLTPEGRIIQPSRVVKSSGAAEWDEAVLRAIAKTEVLPRDESGKVPPSMTIVYRPRD
jgi:colicin import membrane protein